MKMRCLLCGAVSTDRAIENEDGCCPECGGQEFDDEDLDGTLNEDDFFDDEFDDDEDDDAFACDEFDDDIFGEEFDDDEDPDDRDEEEDW